MNKTVSMEGVSDKYELIRNTLEAYNMALSPKYSGYGLEVYHTKTPLTDMRQMVVDFDRNEIKYKTLEVL